jgi:hypothetical protein
MMPAVVDPDVYTRAAVIVIVPLISIVAVSVIWSWRAHTHANAARSGITLARRRRSVDIDSAKFTNLDGTIGGTTSARLSS